MAKRVFFSFHYEDVSSFRANVVRNHWITKLNRGASGYFDASIWETAKRTNDTALKNLINSELKNTSITAVLIGSETYNRRWVRYEIAKSIEVGNGIIGIHINSVKDKYQKIYHDGPNPFEFMAYEFSSDGWSVLRLWEFKNDNWVPYNDLNVNYKLSNQIRHDYRGKLIRMSEFHKVLDWVKHDGYNNFAFWIDS